VLFFCALFLHFCTWIFNFLNFLDHGWFGLSFKNSGLDLVRKMWQSARFRYLEHWPTVQWATAVKKKWVRINERHTNSLTLMTWLTHKRPGLYLNLPCITQWFSFDSHLACWLSFSFFSLLLFGLRVGVTFRGYCC